MPKSRHRKNHKKKVESFKKRRVDNANATNKEMMRIQEDLMKKCKTIAKLATLGLVRESSTVTVA